MPIEKNSDLNCYCSKKTPKHIFEKTEKKRVTTYTGKIAIGGEG